MKYIPEQGDLAWLDFDPSSGKEIIKRRPAYVISRKTFNKHTEMAIVAPITSVIRGIKLEVVLPENLSISGSILIHHIKSLDYLYRNATFIERVSKSVINEVTALIDIIIH